jgi:hypothetical protein
MKIKNTVLCQVLFCNNGDFRRGNTAARHLRNALTPRQFARLQLKKWRMLDPEGLQYFQQDPNSERRRWIAVPPEGLGS